MWFIFALSFAFITSLTVILAKKIMLEMNEYFYLLISNLVSLPVLIIIILLFYQISKFDSVFIWTTVVTILLNVVAAIFAYRAIRIAEVSLVAPLASFNPVFTALIAFIFMNEYIVFKSVVGILLVCVGAYILQITSLKENPLEPIKKLISNQAVRLSIVAYLIWAITPILQKVSINHTYPSVPPFASLAGLIGSIVVFSLIVFSQKKHDFKLLKKYIYLFIILGVIGAVGQTVSFQAFSLAPLGQVTAVFKISIILNVIIGWLVFKEKDIQVRLPGSLIMFLGVLMIIL